MNNSTKIMSNGLPWKAVGDIDHIQPAMLVDLAIATRYAMFDCDDLISRQPGRALITRISKRMWEQMIASDPLCELANEYCGACTVDWSTSVYNAGCTPFERSITQSANIDDSNIALKELIVRIKEDRYMRISNGLL